MNSNSHTLIRFDTVSRVYGRDATLVHALHQVSIEITSEEFTAIVGPSGCGKSTMLQLMGLLDQPTEGQVYFEGCSTTTLKSPQLADLRLHKIGFVFQDFNLIPVLSAIENIEFPLQLQGTSGKIRRKKAYDLLAKLDIEDIANRRPSDMSGGQQQRVAIARALVSDPVILIADEPSANLDSQTTQDLCNLLRTVNQDFAITIAVASHDPLVMEYARRRIHLLDGRINKDEQV
ncbi:MAG: ABC transporter ATP-binding protein [Gammaproteobacteria bacterium]|nr:ABC transporter ATP-binding protein [Gammaproteobacteria bacterium]MDE0251695.1 ABC transporter ATP-binding protein [Gammaproteobacteria bacterium]MDE0403296.1 ABC transporter ATP-binding protein [Gammaproteobacteria bacterium]